MVDLEDILKQHDNFTASYKVWDGALFLLDYHNKHIYFNPVYMEGEAYIHAMARIYFINEEGQDNARVRTKAKEWAEKEYPNNQLRYYKLAMAMLEPPLYKSNINDIGD